MRKHNLHLTNALTRYRRELAVAAALVVLMAVLAAAAPAFYRGGNLQALLVSAAPVLVAAVGMTLVILARHIDISIAAQFSLCGVVAGSIVATGGPVWLAWLAAVAAGAAFGAINGLLIAGLELPSIVVTLATMFIGREALRWGRQGEAVRNLPDGFQWLGLGQTAGQWFVVAAAAVVFLAAAWMLRYVAAGRAVYAVGSDAEAARLVGIRPRRVVFWVFVLMGGLTGLAAMLGAIRFGDVDANAGNGLELQVIAAVVVGGVAISGGRGRLLGALLGVALLGTIGSALVFLGLEAYWEKAIQGAIILAAIALEAGSPESAPATGAAR